MVRCHRAVRIHDATVLQKKCELEVSRPQFLEAKRDCQQLNMRIGVVHKFFGWDIIVFCGL